MKYAKSLHPKHLRLYMTVVYITRSTAHLDMTFEITKTIS